MAEPWYHYIIVRRDLPPGAAMAQTAHAAGESAALIGAPLPGDVRVVVLSVKDTVELAFTAVALTDAGVESQIIIETEGGIAGEPTALGVKPGPREKIRPLLAHLPIWR